MSLSPNTDDESEYHLEDQAIATPDSQRDVGIASSRNLSWSTHYSAICRKAYNSLHLLWRTLPSCSPIHLKKKLYLTLVRSHFSYCCQLWKPRLIKDINAIERVQRKEKLMFLVKCLKDKEDNMNIHEFIIICYLLHPQELGHLGWAWMPTLPTHWELNISTSTELFDYGIMYSHPPLHYLTQLRPLK